MSKNAYVQDGDVGCGAPGSLSWHKCAVAEMNLDERLAYFIEVQPDMSIDDTFKFMNFLVREAIAEAIANESDNN